MTETQDPTPASAATLAPTGAPAGEATELPGLYSTDEVARRYGVKPDTIRRWRRRGLLRGRKIGGKRFYRPEDLEALEARAQDDHLEAIR